LGRDKTGRATRIDHRAGARLLPAGQAYLQMSLPQASIGERKAIEDSAFIKLIGVPQASVGNAVRAVLLPTGASCASPHSRDTKRERSAREQVVAASWTLAASQNREKKAECGAGA
jgi:hypothetical protein